MFCSKISKIFKYSLISCGLIFILWKAFGFLEQNGCLDDGNVWDYQEGRCRNDCLAWNSINGCIKMNAEQIKIFEDCRYKPTGCVPTKVFNEICLNNNLPINKKTGKCDIEFTVDKCNQLGNDWLYPDICKK